MRRALDEQAARLAARRATPEQRERLRTLAERFGNVTTASLADDDAGRHGYYALVTEFDATIDQALGRMAHDRNATIDDQLAWMEAAGFAEVDLWFKQWFFCVYAGRKPH